MKMGLPATAVAGLQNLGPLQCVIVIDKPAFLVVQGNKWFENLYIVPVRDVVAPGLAAISIASFTYKSGVGTNVFITNMTIQGEGSRTVRAIDISGKYQNLRAELPVYRGKPLYTESSSRHSVLIQGVMLYHSP
jgi:hypothetical protein